MRDLLNYLSTNNLKTTFAGLALWIHVAAMLAACGFSMSCVTPEIITQVIAGAGLIFSKDHDN